MSNEPRQDRSTETREAVKRWQPAATLPEPDPKDGWAFRWIRASTLGVDDPMNISRQRREGWEPVRAEDHPEIPVQIGFGKDRGGRVSGNIEIGGLILCKIPEEFMLQRREHFDELAKQQITSVDAQLMRENNKAMPLFKEAKSRRSSTWNED